MRVKTLQIVWHGKDPVLSADFHPSGIVATAGADKEIKVIDPSPFLQLIHQRQDNLTRPSFLQLWKITTTANGAPHAEYVESLSHHANAVNVVRFSPSGEGDETGCGANSTEKTRCNNHPGFHRLLNMRCLFLCALNCRRSVGLWSRR